ncbi:DUF3823 domain-containing protein [Sphingobacterium corticibacter]|uniref:DUF3823 domain-containing protein n=1 Tax=Sphingobacterium corticibacter TaxID=2171749 RepID=A0A2T8HIL5_9SPHI|nr:DUF3823 domain-containing protein [Sphingobacterium corticibacter]PVH25230.1 hypothetical protein DC487_09910 [Sphingobacterium corticibacter]
MRRINIKYSIGLVLITILMSNSACSFFELDNYDAPDVTLNGEVVDVLTGKPVLTDQGSEGTRVRLTELSWGDNVEHNPDFYCMPDGKFQNTKLFKGNYHITVDGPFIPLQRRGTDGAIIADESIVMDLENTHSVRMEVQPFLQVEWVGEPTVSNGKITAQVRVTRGVNPADFKAKVEPMGNYNDNLLNMTDIQFFVSYSSSIGYRARDERWSTRIDYSGSDFNSLFGQTITVTSNGQIPSGRTVFIRAAARINYDTPVGSGVRRWNYNEAKEVLVN